MVHDTPLNAGAASDAGPQRPTPTEAEFRATAIRRLKKKRDFRNHLFIYVVINLALWVIWIVAGLVETWQFPWPLFPTAIWGIFLLVHARETYWDTLDEASVQREIQSLRAAAGTHPIDTYDRDDDIL